ncbi:hypothetical protein AWB74_08520 [Caballeronia arvi]|uniref:DUF736 domain-containing protein n=1 Tax=Caballeronia arvi TaxID=1777135 RepID=A0A158L5R0_9BURK|nr:hypothetical protein AWB74_08520 [Caballeronia arvi]
MPRCVSSRTNPPPPAIRRNTCVCSSQASKPVPRRRTSKDNRSCHSFKLDDPSFTAPIYANLFEGDDATGEVNLCSQTSIDCWAKIPAIAPCDDAWVTEGRKGVVRSPAA